MRVVFLISSCILSLTVGCSLIASRLASTAADPRVTVFTLLADNRLLAVRADNGAVLAEHALAPAPASSTIRFTGHYLALSSDRRKLYALAPGDQGQPDHLSAVEVKTVQIRARYVLKQGIMFRSLALGPATGRLYLFGNQPERTVTPFGTHTKGVIVNVLDPYRGTLLANWTARKPQNHDWLVYQGMVSDNERELFISYHGPDTTGIDSFVVTSHGLRRCGISTEPGAGCIRTHGGFTLYGGGLLAATGEPFIEATDGVGRIRRIFDTRLRGNHLMEFVVDTHASRLYAVGSCGYTGGFSRIDLKTGHTQVLVPPSAPADYSTPAAVEHTVCGERLALGPDALLVVGKTAEPVPQSRIPGALLFLDARTGKVLRTVVTPSEPVDVAVVAQP